jgi:arsenate reductase
MEKYRYAFRLDAAPFAAWLTPEERSLRRSRLDPIARRAQRVEPEARMTVVIYHNPSCGTSRKVLARLKEAGLSPQVVLYLKTPPDRATLKSLLKSMGRPARDILRKRGTPYEELGLGDPAVTDDQIFAAIEKHPILIERPIVVVDGKAALCRPPEAVEALLG